MKILIVDDDMRCLKDISESLKPTGYEIRKSQSAKNALTIIEHEDFDVIITDIRMPEMNGFEFLEQMTLIRPSIRVIAMTAYRDIKAIAKFTNLRGYDYFAKPIIFNDLIDCLKRIEKEIQEKTDFRWVKVEPRMVMKMNQAIDHILFHSENTRVKKSAIGYW